jgi:hypothetical protein
MQLHKTSNQPDVKGMTIASAIIEFSGRFPTQQKNKFFSQVNKAAETGTLLPKLHLSVLPSPSASYTGMDRTIYRENGYTQEEVVTQIKDALKAHQAAARCHTIYFDFRHVAPDEPLYLKSLEQCLTETGLNADTKMTTWSSNL